MPQNVEIERKFLIEKPPPGWKKWPHKKIVQGYLPIRDKKLEVRLRHKGSQYFITIKAGLGHIRLEEEVEISKEKFRSLWPLTKGHRISKRRFQTPHAGRMIEMDIYEEPRKGLITAEVEFDSLAESRTFRFPDWFGRDITGVKKYSNRRLAV